MTKYYTALNKDILCLSAWMFMDFKMVRKARDQTNNESKRFNRAHSVPDAVPGTYIKTRSDPVG